MVVAVPTMLEDSDRVDPTDFVDEKIVQAKQGFLEMNKVMKKRWSVSLPRSPMGESLFFMLLWEYLFW